MCVLVDWWQQAAGAGDLHGVGCRAVTAESAAEYRLFWVLQPTQLCVVVYFAVVTAMRPAVPSFFLQVKGCFC